MKGLVDDSAGPEERLSFLLSTPTNELPRTLVNRVLKEIWPGLRGPLHRYERARLLALFARAGFVSDGLAVPSSSLVLYRGALSDLGEVGISWTTDQEIGLWYANGYRTVGETTCWKARAAPEAVLAMFVSEQEVVVNPDLLSEMRPIRRFDYFPPPAMVYNWPSGDSFGQNRMLEWQEG